MKAVKYAGFTLQATVTQRIEHLNYTQKVRGLNPFERTLFYAQIHDLPSI
jgi:hypothetical protein